jgi:hypothetical protein
VRRLVEAAAEVVRVVDEGAAAGVGEGGHYSFGALQGVAAVAELIEYVVLPPLRFCSAVAPVV